MKNEYTSSRFCEQIEKQMKNFTWIIIYDIVWKANKILSLKSNYPTFFKDFR